MDKKSLQQFFKKFGKSNTFFVLCNLLLVIPVSGILLWILHSRMDKYTEHGVEIEVPDVRRMHVTEARPILEQDQLHLIILDSTYTDAVPFGTIVEQNPAPGLHVKHGRSIYVTVNASGKRRHTLPNLVNYSQRQAQANLSTLHMVIDSVAYETGEYGLLEIRDTHGRTLEPGTSIPEGTHLILVMGQSATLQVRMPNLIGKTQEEADLILQSLHLKAHFISDEAEALGTQYIYRQAIEPEEMVDEAYEIDLYTSHQLDKAFNKSSDDNDDEFSF